MADCELSIFSTLRRQGTHCRTQLENSKTLKISVNTSGTMYNLQEAEPTS